jgi:hypothetical protein
MTWIPFHHNHLDWIPSILRTRLRQPYSYCHTISPDASNLPRELYLILHCYLRRMVYNSKGEISALDAHCSLYRGWLKGEKVIKCREKLWIQFGNWFYKLQHVASVSEMLQTGAN